MGDIFKMLGASNHTELERQVDDFYATDPIAIDYLCEQESFTKTVWECACGKCHLANRLHDFGYDVIATDLNDWGCSKSGVDFLTQTKGYGCDIITNPPYKTALQFAYKGLELCENKLALLLRLQFLEGKERKKFFIKHPPKFVYVFSSRLLCAKDGDFEAFIKRGGSAIAYAWFVWYKDFSGDPSIRWVG